MGSQHLRQSTQPLPWTLRMHLVLLHPFYAVYTNLPTLSASSRTNAFPLSSRSSGSCNSCKLQLPFNPLKRHLSWLLQHIAAPRILSIALANAWSVSATPKILSVCHQLGSREILVCVQGHDYTFKPWIRWVVVGIITRFWLPTN